jgi:molybdenum cofactor cytidylyltransferase
MQSKNESQTGKIAAIVLAAGQSRRMGRPKLTLPWGNRTVIEQVITTLLEAGISEIVVVSGGYRELLEEVLATYPVSMIYNPIYQQSEMTESLKTGIQELSETTQAFLVVLGDQPSIDADVIRQVVARYQEERPQLVIPSYNMRRGHPWLVDRSLWNDLLSLNPEETMRDFLNRNQKGIRYQVVDNPEILMDIDTPEDYDRFRPEK